MKKKDLSGFIFSFGRIGGAILSSSLELKANGKVIFGKKVSPNEKYWRLNGDDLVILNENYEVTTSFPRALYELDRNGKVVGEFVPNSTVKHYLKIEMTKDDFLQKIIEKNQFDLKFQHLLELRDKRKNAKPHIAFVLNATQTSTQWVALIHKFQQDNRFDVRVIPQNRVFRRVEQPGTKEILEKTLENEGIDYVMNNTDYPKEFERLMKWNPDYIFRQSEWDGDWPSVFTSSNFFWTKLIHMPYPVTDEFMAYQWDKNKTLFEVPDFGNFWRSYIPVELPQYVKDRLKKTYTAEEIFKAVGSIKALQIKNSKAKWFTETESKKLIWMPHHSLGNFSTFDRVYKEMLQWAKDHPEISICFKPHPSLPEVIKTMPKRISWKQWEEFLMEWQDLPNTAYIIDGSSYPYVVASDVVLSDGVSILYEAQILEKPIVYNESEKHEPFTPTGIEMMKGVHIEGNFEAAMNKVLYLFDNKDSLKEIQKENMKPYLVVENPEENIVKDIWNDWQLEKNK